LIADAINPDAARVTTYFTSEMKAAVSMTLRTRPRHLP